MPILFAPLIAIALGAFFAWLARGELARHEASAVASRGFGVVALFAIFVYAPIVGYFAAFHADWAYLYWIRPRAMASAIDLALVLASGGTVLLGFLAAARWARIERLGPVAIIGAVPVAVVLSLAMVWQRRLSTSATFAHFHGDFGTEPITSSVLGRGVLLMDVLGLAGIVWCGLQMRSMSRRRSHASAGPLSGTAPPSGAGPSKRWQKRKH
ncbi:hypothetical protein LVJ94_12060 [Pendulispora rubella]|uniref:Uncharacterized protein n=1 Tax=Pendulispora rubella TaxID=2741070 RepID=A0ABZ2LGP1_9BACT